MQLDDLSNEERQALWALLTRRRMRNDAAMEQALPSAGPLDDAPIEVMPLDAELMRLEGERAAIAADLLRYAHGEVRDELVARMLGIRDQTLIPLTDVGVDLVFDQTLARTGSATPYLWLARHHDATRPLIVRIGDVLRWELQPPVGADDDDALRRAALQLAMPRIRQAVARPDFFADHTDEVIELASGQVPSAWDAQRRYQE